MPWWYFEKEDLKSTPTRRDGVDFETEKRYRREATAFIKDCGNMMSLGYATMHTAIVMMHRFYMFHSFKTFPRYVTACSCLFLAGKVEETPKKCKDIIRKAQTILANSPHQLASFGDDPKEEVITMERILLKTIKFDLQIDHPYRFLIEYAKCLKSNGAVPKEQVVQKAWNFINDSLELTICLQWEPEIIAVAMMYLACKMSKYEVVDWRGKAPEHQKWWDMFVKDMTKNVLEEICHQVLDLYSGNKIPAVAPPDSPPQCPPSKASPPLKRARLQQQSPNAPPAKIAAANHIPVKLSSADQVPPIHNAFAYASASTSYNNHIAPPLPTHPGILQKPPMPNNLPPAQPPPPQSGYPNEFQQMRYPHSAPQQHPQQQHGFYSQQQQQGYGYPNRHRNSNQQYQYHQ